MERRTGNPRGLIPDGQKIRELREDCGLTVAQLAQAVDRTPLYIRKIELYSKPVSKVTASRIANTLSVKREVTREEILATDGGDIESEPGPKVPAA